MLGLFLSVCRLGDLVLSRAVAYGTSAPCNGTAAGGVAKTQHFHQFCLIRLVYFLRFYAVATRLAVCASIP